MSLHQGLVAGGGQDAVRVVALVEHQALEEHFAVELDFIAFDRNAAQAGIAGGLVDDCAGSVQQDQIQVVQEGVAGLPQMPARGRDGQVQGTG